MNAALKKLIQIAGAALEAEDRVLLGSIAANNLAYPNENGGILRMNNERYYQFIIARALVSSFLYPVEIEVNSHDLVLMDPNNNSKWFAVIEMKRWMSENGTQEIPSILSDIQKLRSTNAAHNMMMIFSANPKGSTAYQLKWLANELGFSSNNNQTWESYCFPTLDKNGNELEFWVAGYEL